MVSRLLPLGPLQTAFINNINRELTKVYFIQNTKSQQQVVTPWQQHMAHRQQAGSVRFIFNPCVVMMTTWSQHIHCATMTTWSPNDDSLKVA